MKKAVTFVLWIFCVFLAFGLPVVAQTPEVEALREMIFAKDDAHFLKHLPVSVNKALEKMPEAKRRAAIERIDLRKGLLAQSSVKLDDGEDDVLAFVSITRGRPTREGHKKMEDAVDKIQLKVTHDISNGSQAMLQLALSPVAADGASNMKDAMGIGLDHMGCIVLMRYDDGEWRLSSLIGGFSMGDLEDPVFITKMTDAEMSANEISAVGSVRTINTAEVVYTTSYPEDGFADTLTKLGPLAAGEKSSRDRSGLMDEVLAAGTKSGYVFTLKGVSPAPYHGYTVIARPVAYGESGKRSFFSDETGVIRFTEEDREPTEKDSPL